MTLDTLPGIGKIRLQSLHAAGINSLRDLLFTLPVKYKDVSCNVSIDEAQVGTRVCMLLIRQGEAKMARFGKRTKTTCQWVDASGDKITSCWFNQPWIKEVINKQTRLRLYGLVSMQGANKQLMNPSIEKEQGIIPMYRPIEGVPLKTFQTIMKEALMEADALCKETLPSDICRAHHLWSLSHAMRALHAPKDMDEVAGAQRRFAFEQMLLYQAAVASIRNLRLQSNAMGIPKSSVSEFWSSMPFQPTTAQERTLQEIVEDLQKPHAMARLVQGDVGSGKTAVALGAMVASVKAGYQCALMAPTEILARQHFDGMQAFLAKQGITCALLTGSLKASEKRNVLASLQDGSCQIAIGTHALLSKTVHFANLGLCVTDEQHRFGVAQRTTLLSKGQQEEQSDCMPHLLVMSATPIPRSLALVMYGDLDVSIIDELPPGRQAVITRLVPESKRSSMYDFLKKELDAGYQAYIVCPLVEENEQTEDDLKSVKTHVTELSKDALNGYRVGLVYGGQASTEQQEVLSQFARGQIQVLVATTVIEVGINVPDATIMVIENADRFGLAQLHQLRGRVGRGQAQSWCFLLAKPNERLRSLVASNDGFEIAKADLQLRGPGELLGTRQHGESMLPGGKIAYGDMPLLYEVAECAKTLRTEPRYQQTWESLCESANAILVTFGERISIS